MDFPRRCPLPLFPNALHVTRVIAIPLWGRSYLFARTGMKWLVVVVVAAVLTALSFVVYAVSNQPLSFIGLVAAVVIVFIAAFLDAMKRKQRPGEQVNF